MVTAAAQSPNAHRNPTGDWTIVSRRRRGKQQHNNKNPSPSATQDLTLIPDSPQPWTPPESSTDPERESRLLNRMRSTINRLERSKFYRSFLSRLQDANVQAGLKRACASGSAFQMVAYGLGSIETYDPPRLQLALALLLKRELGEVIESVEAFDPVLSATECSVLEALGCYVIPVDERGRREARRPTLFYMPHCEAALYDNLLSKNWASARLNRMVVLGNSFGEYQRYVEGVGAGRGSVAVAAEARHVLGVRKYMKEFGMVEGLAAKGCEDDDDDGFFKAFHDLSWHFFELDDDTDMNFV